MKRALLSAVLALGLLSATAHAQTTGGGGGLAAGGTAGQVATSNGGSAPTYQNPVSTLFVVKVASVDISVAGDTSITLPAWVTTWWHTGSNSFGDMITNCTGSVNTADVIGIFTAASGGGTEIDGPWSSTNLGHLTTASGVALGAIGGTIANQTFTGSTLFIHVTTPDTTSGLKCDFYTPLMARQ